MARAIEEAFNLQAGWMDHQPAGNVDETPISFHNSPPAADFAARNRRVAVAGTASMGMDGYWVDLEYPAGHGDGYFTFPTNDPGAYVLQVKGGSMHPAIRSGWYILIEPHARLHAGEYVMIKLIDGRSSVKELLWHRDGEYTLQTVSSGERLVIDVANVEKVHAVKAILAPSGRQA